MTPAWTPTDADIKRTNLYALMQEKSFSTYEELLKWSQDNRAEFWEKTIELLGISFKSPPKKILNLDKGAEHPVWLEGATLNIALSCFQSETNKPAIVYQKEGGSLQTISYGELDTLSNQVANGLIEHGFLKGDAIAIDMLMNMESVAIYLGILKAGCVAVSIADSFAPNEIATRLKIAKAKGIFTQDKLIRGDKSLPLYEKVTEAGSPKAIVLNASDKLSVSLREGDISWQDFLSDKKDFEAAIANPNDPVNILFSSGTTGDPKAIAWSHLTPIKAAMDGHFHHDIHPEDVVAWPTNLGWMMGPWLIFASLMNKATIALYEGMPTTREFGEFIQDAKVSMLGLVPSIVKAWRGSECMKGLDWSSIKCFSSTGECSNAEDYLYLMSLANNRPVIEYCGGTEIGGGYITGSLVQAAVPATFTTPTLGLDIEIIEGELFLVPPSIGLSQTLLNRDHHEVYFKDTPIGKNGKPLRRHGDQFEQIGNYYRGLGRADDTMNLGGIKTSSAEIERIANTADGVVETAAIAVSPKGGGPSELVLFVVTAKQVDEDKLTKDIQQKIKTNLNPLFKIKSLKLIDKLPRTASNKVMRRRLRDLMRGS